MARPRHYAESRLDALRLPQVGFLLAYLLIRAEPHILLFKRPLGTDPKTGQISPELLEQMEIEANEQRMRVAAMIAMADKQVQC